MSTQAKAALEVAVTDHKHASAMVKKSLNSTAPKERVLRNKMTSLTEALGRLNSAHTQWVFKSGLNSEQLLEETYSTAWLESEWNSVDDIQEQVDELLTRDAPAPQTATQHLQILETKMETLQKEITTKLQSLLNDTQPYTSSSIYGSILQSATNLLAGDFSTLADQIMSLDCENIVQRCKSFEEFRSEQQKDIVAVQLRIAHSIPPPKPTCAPTRNIEMEKSKAPSFSGRTMHYPEFKRGWNKTAGIHWSDDNQVEQIKFHVDSETRLIISRCTTMAEVWEVLDAEFAQEEEVINSVNQELKALRLMECSVPEYIVKLRNHLPNLEDALKNVNGLDHLCSPDRVNYLTTKFDDRTLHDWDYFRSKESGTTYERFFKFLIDRYEASKSSIARSKSTTLTSMIPPPTHSINVTTNVDTDCRRCRTWVARDKIHTCPGCGRGTQVNEKINHCLEHCGVYMHMSVNERSNCVENANWCPVHLVGTHTLADCNMATGNRSVCGINDCLRHHHKSLHGGTTPFMASIHTTLTNEPSTAQSADDVLFSIQSIPTALGSLNCMFDNCASCCLISRHSAERLGLKGKSTNLLITTVAGTTTVESFSYTVPLFDINNECHFITAYEVESITNDIPEVDVSGVKHKFSRETQRMWDLLATRPTGEIELLIGSNNLKVHPLDYELKDNLKVLTSIFGSGFILTGSDPAIKSGKFLWNADVSAIRHVSSTTSSHVVNRISVKPDYDYFQSENMGVQPPRRCGNCRKCKECSFRGQMLSQQEQYEYQVIESKMNYDPNLKSFSVSYPFTEDPCILPDNKRQVVKIAEREEKRLSKLGLLDNFNKEFDKMLQNGGLVELSSQELDMWEGPVHYVSLQHVLNPDSTTTPLRIVTNSSLSNRNGLSLNSILMKGPNTLSDQWEILNRWRSYEVGLCSDVTKAYHSMRTGEVEKHVRRVVWRYGLQEHAWRVFGFCTISFGDRPAAAMLEIAVKQTAQVNSHIDPEAASRILNDRYVDDFATGGTRCQVTRFIGKEGPDFQCDGTFPAILSEGSLRLKALVATGECNELKIAKLGGKVLGLGWHPPNDKISIDLTVTLKDENDNKITLSPSRIDTIQEEMLTPSNVLSITNGMYDPLGLCAPITVRLRVAFRNLFIAGPITWNDPIPSVSDRKIWLDLIQMMVNAGNVSFNRNYKPANAVGKCQLVCFFDGSDVAFAAVIYIRWSLSDGSIFVTLQCAKPRVTPLQRISTPRSELNGAVVAARLILSSLRSLSGSAITPERAWIIGDSECTLASIEKTNAAFGEYFGNRIGEILDLQAQIEEFCPVGENGEWWYTDTLNNAADRATRLDSAIEDVSEGSEWQTGPSYLKQPPSEWPIDREFANRKEQCIPQNELLKRFRCIVQVVQADGIPGIEQLIDPHCTNYWLRLIRKTQILLHPFLKKKNTLVNDATTINAAKRLWFLSCMPATIEALGAGKLKELDIQDIDGLKVMCGRASAGLKKFFGQNFLPVIMGSTRVAYLIMLHAHCKDHTGRDVTMAMSRLDAWIVGAKRLAKGIVRNCIRCRFLRKQLAGQKMAAIPPHLQVPSPPFSNIGLDLSGPLVVKSMTNKRSTLKVWVVIFLCLNTKAVSMELAPGYATEDFLLAYYNHTSIRGTPAFVHSDRGSQLVAAHSEVADAPLRYDWDLIANQTSSKGTTWKFAPAGGQWRNGAAEAFVKKFKLSFQHLYQNTRFNYAELGTAVKRISNTLNDRPISVQRTMSDAQDEDFLSPLTPNMLLIGGTATDPPREYVDVEDPHLRKSFIEELESAWWCQYKVQYFDSLLPTRKWVDIQRNMSVGDVVLIRYSSKTVPGTYRLGRVSAVEVTPDELVRTCTVKYNLFKKDPPNKTSMDDVVRKEVRVPVQRLVLILPVEEQ